MKKTGLILIALIVIIGLGSFGYNRLKETEKPKEVPVEQKDNTSKDNKKTKSPNIDMLRFEGGSNELTDFIGEKPIVLNFWASKCPPCAAEMPVFEEIYQDNKEDVQFLMVNIIGFNGETEQTAKSFIKENNYSLPVYFEIDHEASEKYELSSIPQTFFIDKKGNIVSEHKGMIEKQQLETAIVDLKQSN